jgi:hypothetical protein
VRVDVGEQRPALLQGRRIGPEVPLAQPHRADRQADQGAHRAVAPRDDLGRAPAHVRDHQIAGRQLRKRVDHRAVDQLRLALAAHDLDAGAQDLLRRDQEVDRVLRLAQRLRADRGDPDRADLVDDPAVLARDRERALDRVLRQPPGVVEPLRQPAEAALVAHGAQAAARPHVRHEQEEGVAADIDRGKPRRAAGRFRHCTGAGPQSIDVDQPFHTMTASPVPSALAM